MKSLARSYLHQRTVTMQRDATRLLPLSEEQAIQCLQKSFTTPPLNAPVINRMDFAFAFDPIAASDSTQPTSYLEPSVFDRNMELITLDVAPYVRSIVAYDVRLQRQRLKHSNLVSEGGRAGPKRMRTTRTALSALEGGSRSTVRGEKWFKADINPYLVAKTAGAGWNGFDKEDLATSEEQVKSSFQNSTYNISSVTTPSKEEMVAGRPKRQKVVAVETDDDLT
jgi:hypothetical protein